MSDAVIRELWQAKRRTANSVERRNLEPIITAILTHNFKLAASHCSKLLRTKPYWPLVQALSAVTLCRQGEYEQHTALVRAIAKDDKGKGKGLVGDIQVLLLCTWLFEQAKLRDEAVEMWRSALASSASDLNLAIEGGYYFLRASAYAHLQELCDRILDKREADEAAGRPPSAALATTAQAQRGQEAEFYHQTFWYSIAATVVQVGDYLAAKQNEEAATSAATIAKASGQYSRSRVHLSDTREGDPAGRIRKLLAGAKRRLFSPGQESELIDSNESISAVLERCKDYHHFYLVTRVLELDILFSRTQESISALSRVLEAPKGREFAARNVDIKLLSRRLALWLLELPPAEQNGEKDRQQRLCDLHTGLLQQLKDGDEDWDTISTTVRAAYMRAAATNQQELLDQTERTLRELGETEGTDGSFSKQERGYTLGLLLLASRRAEAGPSIELAGLIRLYISRHADRPCCFGDLKPYLVLLEKQENRAEQSASILSWLDERYPASADVNISTLQAMQASITAECLRRNLQRKYGGAEEELTRGHRLAKAYFSALHYGKDNLPTDLQPADDLAFLAAQCYLGAYTVSSASVLEQAKHLELAIGILEFAVRRSKYRFQIRILLIQLYQLAGAPDLAMKHWEELKPRQIQLDSLGFWQLQRASAAASLPLDHPANGMITLDREGEKPDMLKTLVHTNAWYPVADDESGGSLVRAWQQHAFILVEDYASLKDRLSVSHSRYSVGLERWRSRTKLLGALSDADRQQALKSLDEILQICGMSDNRDRTILPNYQPAAELDVYEQTQVAAETDERWLHQVAEAYRSLIKPEQGTATSVEKQAETSAGETRMTGVEVKFCKWAKTTSAWLSGEEAKVEDIAITGFFKECQTAMASLDMAGSIARFLHIASLALEAYSLLDSAYVKLNEADKAAASTSAFKNIKQFRQIRQDSKGCLKAISTRLKQTSEDLGRRYKGKLRVESLQPLKQYEQVDDGLLLEFGTQLLDARKDALVQLAGSITKRIAGS